MLNCKAVNLWKLVLATLALSATAVFIAASSTPSQENLQIIACDVGQGDGLLIIQGENQIVVDGGPNTKISNCLDSHIPFYDRNIELVIMTHPQYDHYRGRVEVFENYEVNAFLTTSLDSDAAAFAKLKEAVKLTNVQIITPDAGKVIRIGEIELEVVHPSYDFQITQSSNEELPEKAVLGAYTTLRDPNDYSVVVNLTFQDFDVLLTGDIGPEVIEEVMETGLLNDIEYLKVPHHGSKNGLNKELLDATAPEIAVIQVGVDNRFDHPHKSIIDLLENEGIIILRTDLDGEVVVESDGESWWVD